MELHLLENTLKSFNAVSLEQIEEVKLLNRTDLKYVMDERILLEILPKLHENYEVLEINGKRCMEYSTEYFDTPQLKLFLMHHQDKANRFKIRWRRYLDSNAAFLEIKIKNNKGRTIKKRIPFQNKPDVQTIKEFLKQNNFHIEEPLLLSVKNHFNRITLVNKNKKERLTIDVNLFFEYKGSKMQMSNLVITEVKRDKSMGLSPFMRLMKEYHITPKGISKYVLGLYFLAENIKKNRFHMKLREILKRLNYVNISVAR